MRDLEIRKATVADATLILDFVRQLAVYEKTESEVKATIDDLKNTLFSEDSNTHAVICSLAEKPVGFAVYFYNYSTWLGKKGLYLEDIYVNPQYRKQGIGKQLFNYLARTAVDNDCGRFEWSVLNWNEPAIKFYESIGAQLQSEWVIYRLTGKALIDLANEYKES
jgi:GNAT superfamily N-acetyltransferase